MTRHTAHLIATTPPRWQLPVACACTAGVFLAMDAVWLTSTHARLYQPALGHLMSGGIDWIAAALFYAIYIAGLVVFAVQPALQARRPLVALGRGAALGLLAYATYDLTNQATLRGWPWHVTLIDLAWGSTVSGTASWAAAAITSRRASRTRGR